MSSEPNPGTPAVVGAVRRRGWFAHPVLSVLLAASWLALSHSLALVHLISAALIGLIVPRLLRAFLGDAEYIHWPSAWRLLWVVLKDIVLSNIAVARLVLGRIDRIQPAWIQVPLATKHHRVNALLAMIITTTPGTVSAVIDEDRDFILVHALNCDDAPAMVDDIKTRYEGALLRVFRIQPENPA
ncbi:Na+/H+ antiporter subunit E [Hydrogenophaga sp.]|uniref:Na+/H+ antiporter subunit E n=1 Tax=Hydrogenophaga sp. TaxID=1904254 RepID=UPI003564C494